MTTEALDDITVRSLVLNNGPIGFDVVEAITSANVVRTIEGASTFTLMVEDPQRLLIRSGLFDKTLVCMVDKFSFSMAQVRKTGSSIELTFEDMGVAALRRHIDPMTIVAGTLTRVGFAQLLVAQEPWLKFVTEPGPYDVVGVAMAQGSSTATAATKPEDSWTALTRIATAVGWRAFIIGSIVYFVSEKYLFQGPSSATLSEDTNGVDDIDFDFDSGKYVASVTVHCRANRWVWPPGTLITLVGMGPANGNWLVTDIKRSLFSTAAEVTLKKPDPVITEDALAKSAATTAADAAGGATTNVADTGSSGAKALLAINYARNQIGTPYAWGAEKAGVGFDCSGLTQAAYASVGVTIPRVAQAQYNAGPMVDLSTDTLLVGDLLFFGTTTTDISHVGMYAGSQQMVDAPSPGQLVRLESTPIDIGGMWGNDKLVGVTRPVPPIAPVTTDGSAGPFTFESLITLWVKNGGAKAASAVAAAIAMAESKGNADALNDNASTGDYSVGLWQINFFGNLLEVRLQQFGTPEELKDPVKNVKAAITMSGNGKNFGPWSTYNNGAYKKYLKSVTVTIPGVGKVTYP